MKKTIALLGSIMLLSSTVIYGQDSIPPAALTFNQDLCSTPYEGENFLTSIPPDELLAHKGYVLNIRVHLVKPIEGFYPQEEEYEPILAYMYDKFKSHNICFNLIGVDSIVYSSLAYVDEEIVFEELFAPNSQANAIDIYISTQGLGSFAHGIPSLQQTSGTSLFLGGVAFNKEKVLCHEMGHVLGLFHTYHGSHEVEVGEYTCEENPLGGNGDICGDYVESTPADPGAGILQPNLEAEYNGHLQDCSWVQTGGSPQYFPSMANFMAAKTSCRGGFKLEQAQRMRNHIGHYPSLAPVVSSTFHVLSEDLVINAGESYVFNEDVLLKEGVKIIVKTGGVLEVNNAKLSGAMACNTTALHWEGIEVWGTPSQPQLPEYQGTVVLNNASIEYSKKGIYSKFSATVLNTDDGKVLDFGYSGAIIQATNTRFINNEETITLKAYQNRNSAGIEEANVSFFNKCKFILNDALPEAFEPEELIDLYGVNGVTFRGCDILDQRTNAELIDGIYLGNASLNLRGYCNGEDEEGNCSSLRKNRLEGLLCGIRSVGQLNQHFTTVKHSSIKARVGMHMGGATNPLIEANTFRVQGDSGAGLYLKNSSGYTVQNNKFYKANGESETGLILWDTGEEQNRIYKNDFVDQTYALHACGANRHEWNTGKGLKLLCNNFSSNAYDMAVSSLGGGSNQGISHFQGDLDEPAGNTFSHNTEFLYSDLRNNAEHLTYYYKAGDAQETPNPVVNEQPNVTTIATSAFNDCPSLAEEISILQGDILYLEEVIEVKKADLHGLVDGGDTEALSNEVVFSQYSEALELYYTLMSNSPYLSEKVLLEAIEKEWELPSALLTLILHANYQAAKSAEVQSKLDARVLPLSEFQRALINEGLALVSAKENLEAQISALENQKQVYENQLLRRYIETGHAGQYQLLGAASRASNQYSLVLDYLLQEEYAAAQLLLNNLSLNDLSPAATADLERFSQYAGVLERVQNNTYTAAQMEALFELYQSKEKASYYAQALLKELGYVFDFEVDIPVPNAASSLRLAQAPLTKTKNKILLYPNPTSGLLFIDLLEYTTGVKTMLVVDLLGKKVKTQHFDGLDKLIAVDLSALPSGLYRVQLWDAKLQLVEEQNIELIR